MVLTSYILIIIFLFAVILAYFKIADIFNIIDKPNARSSHSAVTIRGGGIIFPVAAIIAWVFGFASIYLAIAVTLVAVVSFIDDIKPLHQLPRFSSHLIAVVLIMYDLGLFEANLLWLPVILILTIGWINAFNFMDGINGITVLYSIVNIASFAYLYKNEATVLPILIIMGLSCIVFGFFNVRKKAKTFAGDVGSISMAVFLAYFMVKIISEQGQSGYLLFFSVYGIDAIATIMYRLKNRENIFEPHRSHLYQYLANELKWPHIAVSTLYALLQLAINCLTVVLIDKGYMNIWIFFAIGFVFLGAYLVVRKQVIKNIELKNA
jgi:UDP-N-acetylmuramyl pentapeptide phosphotransferase/UDP-N-acetylglucosamine-1-phosphate transferase